MYKGLLFFTCFCFGYLNAQVANQIGASSNGLANTTLLNADVWAVKNNIGAVGFLKKTNVGLTYQNRFLLKEFSNQSVAVNYATENGGFGLYLQQTGFSLFRQVTSGLGYSMKMSSKMAGGVALNLHYIGFGDIYGAKTSVSATVGMLYKLNKNIDLGVNIANLTRAKISPVEDERFPTLFSLGMKYNFNEGTFWAIEVEKDMLHPVNIKSGLEIKAHDIFSVRLGMNSYPFQTALGVGVKLKQFNVNIATIWHTDLGLNPSAGIVYQF